ncbi:uncharacterized protein TRAVEDRAFT_47410 [Trametes versicolor FP-101664 SS1]|uniref:uncharacterized protein n=1 Tax=Trametes versicolor (strain FP-101664) TaxID=717944 RepID=UPI0004621D90|nr:uncharacterized protein TRAVEDRAFT_47410 [Trametes versicolor FP-101664 SS1]EIW58244.1 hypothetical protein TRAVEDRAFT_47410 [Trametes versicolor FP-101664 SS1]
MSKLIDDVFERMADTGAKITRCSRGCIMSHFQQLKRQRLLIRGPDGELALSARFAEVVEQLSKDPTFTEHSLLKNKALIDLKVFRAKNTTKKELYDENAELQEKLDMSEATVARLNNIIESFSTTVEERDAAWQERDKALETLRSLRATLQMTPSNGTGNEHQPMEVDTDEGAHSSAATQHSGHSLQRVPTMPNFAVNEPFTPRRKSTAQLLTPPATDDREPTRRRLARTSASLSYRDFDEQAEGRPMDASGQSVAHGASSEASESRIQLQGATILSAGAADTGEESFDDIQRRLSRLADQTARKEHDHSVREEDLKQKVAVATQRAVSAEERALGAEERAAGAEERAEAAEQRAAASDAAKAILEAKLLDDIAQHNLQVADYERRLEQSKAECLEQSLLTQEARAKAAYMRQNCAMLNRRLVQAVEQSGSVSTLANVRIAELSAEVVSSLDMVYQATHKAQAFVQGIVTTATSFAQNMTSQWPVAW